MLSLSQKRSSISCSDSLKPSISARSISTRCVNPFNCTETCCTALFNSGQNAGSSDGGDPGSSANACLSALIPCPVVPTTGHTIMPPSLACSALISTRIPFTSAASDIVSATTIGSSSPISCCSRYSP